MKAQLLLLPCLGLALLTPARAQLDVSLSAEIRLGRVLPPPPPEVVIIEESGPSGPPPWAPAHGFRRNRAYYYYPGADVYYRPADRAWFYLDGGTWRVGVSLPTSIRVDFDRCVSLTMETERPYEFHDKVRAYYPGDYFVRKVRVKEKGGRPDQMEKSNAGESHGKGKGKGRGKDK
ncbi:MAG TPA: hypothetical protein VGD97_10585 [Lacunisphaera sp.]